MMIKYDMNRNRIGTKMRSKLKITIEMNDTHK